MKRFLAGLALAVSLTLTGTAAPAPSSTPYAAAAAKTVQAKPASKKKSTAKPKKTKTAKPKATTVKKKRAASCTTCARDAHGRIKRSETAKETFMRQTGFPKGRSGYVVDHIIPLACGGPDVPTNMQWQTKAQAKVKDAYERRNCR
jgi:hypothetical protein